MNQNYPNNQYNNQYNGQLYGQSYYVPPALSPEAQQRMKEHAYYMKKRSEEKHDLVVKGVIIGATIISYLIIQTVLVFILQSSKYWQTYNSSALFQNCFNIVAVHICSMAIPFSVMAMILNKKSYRPLVPTKKVGAANMTAWVFLGLGVSMASNLIVNLIIESFKKVGYELTQPEMASSKTPVEYIAMTVSMAIVPAIFEEYAFRCCTLSALRNHGKAFSVVAVSIVFGLVHGNLVQFIFAFIIGCILGYITIKTDSVIPAMLIHGFTNGVSVLNEILESEIGKKTSNTIISIVVLSLFAVSVAAAIYLISKKELFFKQEEKEPILPYSLKFGEKILCLVPGLIIPFMILIFITSQYINKV